jgi:hypothetical protein
MHVSIKVMDEYGRTAHLNPAQLQAMGQTLKDMMEGKLSLRVANDVVINKLEKLGLPVQFEEVADAVG